MAQNPNQFAQAVEKGMLDLQIPGSSISVICDSALVPGQAVKMVDSAGGIPHVTAITADTDIVFGVVKYDIRKAAYAINDRAEVLFFRGGALYMEASAAIARGASVMPVVTGSKVATATTGKRIIGIALDKAANAGDLIRVLVDLPGGVA